LVITAHCYVGKPLDEQEGRAYLALLHTSRQATFIRAAHASTDPPQKLALRTFNS